MNWCKLAAFALGISTLYGFAQVTPAERQAARVMEAPNRVTRLALYDRISDSLSEAQNNNAHYRLIQLLLKNYSKNPQDSFTPDLYNLAGNFYNSTANYSHALDAFEKAAALFRKQQRSQGLSNVLTNVGNTYYYLENYDRALTCYKEALELNEKSTHDEATSSNLYNNIGIIYSTRGNYLMGMNFFRKACRIYERMADSLSIAHAYNNFATIYQDSLTDSAFYYFNESMKLKEKFGTRLDKLDGYHNLASLYFKQGRYDKALGYVQKAIALQDTSVFSIELDHTYQLLSDIYDKKKNPALAYRYYRLNRAIRDTIAERNKVSELLKREVNLEVSKAHLADSLAMAEESRVRNIELAQKKRENTYLLVLLMVAGAIAALLYNRFRVTRRQKHIIAAQKVLVEQKQKEVLDSIHYAKRIQGSLLTSEKYIERTLGKLKQKR
jgi:tetratricopeptide (TPR) repeat protein